MHEETLQTRQQQEGLFIVRAVSVSRRRTVWNKSPTRLFALRYPARDETTSERRGFERKREERLKASTDRQVYTDAGA